MMCALACGRDFASLLGWLHERWTDEATSSFPSLLLLVPKNVSINVSHVRHRIPLGAICISRRQWAGEHPKNRKYGVTES